MTRAVEREHRMLELGIDPRLLAVGAGGDDLREIAVVSDGELARTDRAAEATGTCGMRSSGMIARLRGSTQNSSSASRLSAIGKMPVA